MSPFLCFHPMSCHLLLPFRGWSLDDSEELLQVPSDALQPLTAVPLESEVWAAGVGRHLGNIWNYIFLSFLSAPEKMSTLVRKDNFEKHIMYLILHTPIEQLKKWSRCWDSSTWNTEKIRGFADFSQWAGPAKSGLDPLGRVKNRGWTSKSTIISKNCCVYAGSCMQVFLQNSKKTGLDRWFWKFFLERFILKARSLSQAHGEDGCHAKLSELRLVAVGQVRNINVHKMCPTQLHKAIH